MTGTDSIPPFVTMASMAARRGPVVLADARWYLDGSSGAEAYRQGHLPGAVFVDLDRWLSGPASPAAGRNPLPDPEVFAEGMRAAGISDTDKVIAYDDAGGVIAARLVWMLRVTGHAAALLDGGIQAWTGPLETTVPATTPGRFTAVPWPADRLAGLGDTISGTATVIDARNRDRYQGRQDPIDPRPGHIPGALNLPCRENLDPGGHLLPRPRLLANVQEAGVTAADTVISYCGSGVTACHNLLTLEHLGLVSGKLFVGGWSQYGHRHDLPVETGIPHAECSSSAALQ
ncbi:MAG: sseA1 [Micrococcaceae bacterium]|nr:sseA1 [Micrococcaceae bacterium]